MEKVTISKELAQALLNYLQTKPFAEVHALIAELLKCEPVEPVSAPTEGEA